jgi:predicted ATPase
MPSVLWAGARRKGPVRLRLGVTVGVLGYELACGLPEINDLPSSFSLDPLVKEETVTFLDARSRVALLERGKSGVQARDIEGRRNDFPLALSRSESVLAQLAEPHRYPQLSLLRETLLGWRFYHQFRTDEHAPLRQPQVGVFTPVLGHDGRDLAAALQTIREIGDADGLFRAVRQALDGAELVIEADRARFHVLLQVPGIRRPLEARELSDGTLRYLCLLAALLSPRPPALLALNEPETSLHPDLLPPLARLIVDASRTTQLWITTHSRALADGIEQLSGVAPIVLEKVDGETRIAGRRRVPAPPD